MDKTEDEHEENLLIFSIYSWVHGRCVLALLEGREQKHADRFRDRGGTVGIPIYIGTVFYRP